MAWNCTLKLRLVFDRPLIYSRLQIPYEVHCQSSKRVMAMLRIITGLLVLIACSVPAFAQAAKGVDKQSERVRDGGSERTPANNGNKTDVGTGRGIDFGRGRPPDTPPLPNPYRLSGRRDVIIKAIQDLMRDQKMVVDESASRLSDGIIVTQPFTFTKCAVVSQAEISRYPDVPASG